MKIRRIRENISGGRRRKRRQERRVKKTKKNTTKRGGGMGETTTQEIRSLLLLLWKPDGFTVGGCRHKLTMFFIPPVSIRTPSIFSPSLFFLRVALILWERDRPTRLDLPRSCPTDGPQDTPCMINKEDGGKQKLKWKKAQKEECERYTVHTPHTVYTWTTRLRWHMMGWLGWARLYTADGGGLKRHRGSAQLFETRADPLPTSGMPIWNPFLRYPSSFFPPFLSVCPPLLLLP